MLAIYWKVTVSKIALILQECYFKLAWMIFSIFFLHTGHSMWVGAHSEQQTKCPQGINTEVT